jgi:hypothetical protein
VRFRLTVDQFERLLTVMLAPETPDDWMNLVLMACSRPHAGIISVPVPRTDAIAITAAVSASLPTNPAIEEVAAVLQQQLSSASD